MQGMKTLVGQVLFLFGYVVLFLMVLISGGCSGDSSEDTEAGGDGGSAAFAEDDDDGDGGSSDRSDDEPDDPTEPDGDEPDDADGPEPDEAGEEEMGAEPDRLVDGEDVGTPPNVNDGSGPPDTPSGPGGRCDYDTWVEPNQGEICDDGNHVLSDACTVCVPARCGDGWLQPLGADDIEGTADDEECDDGAEGFNNPYDTCLDTCRRPFCGDGYVNRMDEECDDGSLNGRVGHECNSECKEVDEDRRGVNDPDEEPDPEPDDLDASTGPDASEPVDLDAGVDAG